MGLVLDGLCDWCDRSLSSMSRSFEDIVRPVCEMLRVSVMCYVRGIERSLVLKGRRSSGNNVEGKSVREYAATVSRVSQENRERLN